MTTEHGAEDDSTVLVTEVVTKDLEADIHLAVDNDPADYFDAIVLQVEGVLHDESTLEDVLVVDDLVLTGDDFVAVLTVQSTGEQIVLDSTAAAPQALPVAWVLGKLAAIGIKSLIKWIGKTQAKKAFKSYLLNQVKADKWRHIMASKHKWSTAGARSREQVAELMSRAMVEGAHANYGTAARIATWRYQGKTIQVTYSRSTGKISNGWVR